MGLYQEFNGTAAEFYKACSEALNDLKQAGLKSSQTIDNGAKTATDNLWQETLSPEALQNIIFELIEENRKLLDALKEKNDNTFDKIQGDCERYDKRSLREIIADDIKRDIKALGTACGKVKETVGNAFTKMKDLTKEGLTFIKDKAVEFFKATKEAGKRVGEKVGETAQAIYDKAQEAKAGISNVVKEASAKVTEAKIHCNENIRKPLEKIIEKLDSTKEKLNKQLEEKLNNLDKGENGSKDDFQQE